MQYLLNTVLQTLDIFCTQRIEKKYQLVFKVWLYIKLEFYGCEYS